MSDRRILSGASRPFGASNEEGYICKHAYLEPLKGILPTIELGLKPCRGDGKQQQHDKSLARCEDRNAAKGLRGKLTTGSARSRDGKRQVGFVDHAVQ